jgi:hypothetical protein
MVLESQSTESFTAEQTKLGSKSMHEKNDEMAAYFLQKLEKLATNEEKVALLLDEMKEAISQEGKANFKMFWRAKQLILALFKENLHPIIRSQYWNQFKELSNEASDLKTHLEEATTFALEQIELAITALKGELEKYELSIAQISEPSFPELMEKAGFLKESYMPLYKELTLLDAFSARTNGLRKEVIQMEMRSRDKNRFFKELSAIADFVFPKKREQIQAISEKFSQDVAAFIQKNFQGEINKQKPYFILREEIKGIQGLAKIFLLNTKTFTSTRQGLSECWNQLRELEKERKKEVAKLRQESLEKIAGAKEKIKEFERICQTVGSLKEVENSYEEHIRWMLTLGLNRDEERSLRHALDSAKTLFLEKQKEAKEKDERQKREDLVKRKETMQMLKEGIKTLLGQAGALSLENLLQEDLQIKDSLASLNLSAQEKHLFERLMSPLEGMIEDRKILASPAGESLQEYRELLVQKKKRQSEIKKQLEDYRKTMNASCLDFEKAIFYRELMDMEKVRLEKAEEEIARVEEKIDGLLS